MRTRFSIIFGAVSAALCLAQSAHAQVPKQVPQQISYQGILTTNAGEPVNDGNYSMTFRIYDVPVGGEALWTEAVSVVEVNDGLFNIILGSSHPITLPFNRPYWISTTVGSGSEMTPRTQLTSAPFAFRARYSDTADAVALNSIGAENLRIGSITINRIDATGSVAGQVLTSTGTGVTWQTPSTTTGVTSLNGATGAVTLKGAGGLTVNRSGSELTITGQAGLAQITSIDQAIAVINPTGPAVMLSLIERSLDDFYLRDRGISGSKLRDSTITGRQIASGTIMLSNLADNSVNSQKIIDGSVQNADLANPWVTITPGTGISGGGTVQLGGSITLNNAGVTRLAGTPNQIMASSPTGVITLSTPQDIAPYSSPVFRNLYLTGKATSLSTTIFDPGYTLVTKDFVTMPGNVPVITNFSLVGNGTGFSPLGLNLFNANTWMATQTLPISASQGNALIASINVGTQVIDPARIGNGLTDAQVNNNLTINGGTINNTPIGATTPSTGAFTSISGSSLYLTGKGASAPTQASDGENTLVTKSYVDMRDSTHPVRTDATLVGQGNSLSLLGVNLANSNTWTGTQTLPISAAQGNALIASTNAGTTTVNAVRIGNGLTNAQVNDNLTINGGSINNTPIGDTIETRARFTTSTVTTTLGATTTPTVGTTYRDNVALAWGSVTIDDHGHGMSGFGGGGGGVDINTEMFGNVAITRIGTGQYRLVLPRTPSASSTVATLQSEGYVTVTNSSANTIIIKTYNTSWHSDDISFFFQTFGRP